MVVPSTNSNLYETLWSALSMGAMTATVHAWAPVSSTAICHPPEDGRAARSVSAGVNLVSISEPAGVMVATPPDFDTPNRLNCKPLPLPCRSITNASLPPQPAVIASDHASWPAAAKVMVGLTCAVSKQPKPFVAEVDCVKQLMP